MIPPFSPNHLVQVEIAGFSNHLIYSVHVPNFLCVAHGPQSREVACVNGYWHRFSLHYHFSRVNLNVTKRGKKVIRATRTSNIPLWALNSLSSWWHHFHIIAEKMIAHGQERMLWGQQEKNEESLDSYSNMNAINSKPIQKNFFAFSISLKMVLFLCKLLIN